LFGDDGIGQVVLLADVAPALPGFCGTPAVEEKYCRDRWGRLRDLGKAARLGHDAP
jgi:hypothetical protein